MKLLYCPHCHDIFNLGLALKTCSCGRVKGRYINYEQAEVNGEGYSFAMGSGSFLNAIDNIKTIKTDFREEGDLWGRHPGHILAWARPHTGPANPHTTINPGL